MASQSEPKRDSIVTKPDVEQIEASGRDAPSNEKDVKHKGTRKHEGKRELKEADEYEHLGYSYPTWRKWLVCSSPV